MKFVAVVATEVQMCNAGVPQSLGNLLVTVFSDKDGQWFFFFLKFLLFEVIPVVLGTFIYDF